MTLAHRWNRTIAVAFALLHLVIVTASAQEEVGGLYGTVTESSGEPLPGVNVTLEGVGAAQVQVTDVLGHYRFLGLDPGLYGLKASLDGFSTVEYTQIDIRAGRSTTVEVQLPPAIGEVITVTSESPLLDERKVAQGSILTQVELEAIPTARDPWAVVNQAPGVLVDRINIGGNESGQQSTFTAPSAQLRDNQYVMDGVDVTDLTYNGGTSTYYDFDQFTQFEVSTGGTEITKLTPGVSLNMVAKRGTNEFRGSARLFVTDPDGYLGVLKQSEPRIDPDDLAPGQSADEIVGNQIDGVDEYGFETGGPIWRDRIWIWGSWGRNDIQAVTADGQSDPTLLENLALKLNAQISSANSFVGFGRLDEKTKPARGIAPDVEWEAAWNQGGTAEIAKLEDTHVFTSSMFVTAAWSWVGGPFRLTGNGGEGPDAPEALWDSDGVWKRNYLGYTADRPRTEWKLDGSSFFSSKASSHELKFGASYREQDVLKSQWVWPGRQLLHIAGENWGAEPGPTDFLQAARSEIPSISQQYRTVWFQDTVTLGRWTLNGGLRYDLQEGENNPSRVPANPAFPEILPAVDFPGNDGGGFVWETVSPRLGITYALGQERGTLIRASYARFAEQLGTWDISRVNPVTASYAYAYFIDGNDNNIWDSVDVDSEPVFFYCWNCEVETANINDPSLDPATTDEVVLGLEHAFRPELVTGLNLTWRNVTDIREDRDLVREAETGEERVVTRDDYFLEQTVGGEMPDGRPYSVDFYSLHPGLSFVGGTYRTNGDRKREYLGVTLSLTKRLANQWMLRGYLNFGKTTWDVPDSFSFYDDPTDGRDREDKDGELFMEWGKRGEVMLQSNWAFNLNGMYQLAPEQMWGFNIAGNFYGRQGYPLPYYVTAVSPTDGARRSGATGPSDEFRTQDVFTVDLRLEKDIAITGNLNLVLGVDAFNVFNENYVLRRRLQLNGARPNYLNETLAPRIYRLSVRLKWR